MLNLLRMRKKRDHKKAKLEKFCQKNCGLSYDYCEKAREGLCADLRAKILRLGLGHDLENKQHSGR